MCRFVGGFAPDLKLKIHSMIEAMKYGGDQEPSFYEDCFFSLAHKRLAILDLSQDATQPAQNDRYALAFNGEIYNFKAIAKELSISHQSDTLVLLEALTRWGKECLDKLDGIFAFALYDKLTKKLFCARDRFGVKPLYYYFKDSKFIFASELKAFFAYDDFDKTVDKAGLSHFLNSGYLPSEQSIFKFIKKLEPSHYLEFDKNKLEIHRYYDLRSKFLAPKLSNPLEFETKLEQSVISRTMSDTGFCTFLSGGIDSSATALALSKNGFHPTTISIGFAQNSFDESTFAKKVAKHLNLEHISYTLTPNKAREILDQLVSIYDEPFGDSSAIPTVFLARQTSQTHKVALSSDGGDELNFGYTRYGLNFQRYLFYKKYAFLSFAFLNLPYKSLKFIFESAKQSLGIDKYYRIKDSFKARNFTQIYSLEFRHFKSDEARILGLENIPNLDNFALKDEFETMSLSDLSAYICDDIFVKTDRAGMSCGLEIREPLMGLEFVEYSLGLEPSLRKNKALLKSYLAKYLPKELVERPKMGFSLPLQEWFYGDLRHLLDEYLVDQDSFDKEFVANLLGDFLAKKRVNFAKIYNILIFLMWKKRWRV